ncbi:MAG TPA: hypothetical protein VK979_01585 [Guyparkeria sp.]|nr:hypothetical protein [Guyparkeria sp.]
MIVPPFQAAEQRRPAITSGKMAGLLYDFKSIAAAITGNQAQFFRLPRNPLVGPDAIAWPTGSGGTALLWEWALSAKAASSGSPVISCHGSDA